MAGLEHCVESFAGLPLFLSRGSAARFFLSAKKRNESPQFVHRFGLSIKELRRASTHARYREFVPKRQKKSKNGDQKIRVAEIQLSKIAKLARAEKRDSDAPVPELGPESVHVPPSSTC